MHSVVSSSRYFSILKGKAGEIKALGSAPDLLKRLMVPVIEVPPSGFFDHQTGRVLAPLEHIKTFGARLFSEWGKRLAFVDALNIDDEKHKLGLTVHPLTELIERGSLAGAIVCPATALDRSDDYHRAIKRFVERNASMPICLRLGPGDLENITLESNIRAFLLSLKVDARQVALILDFGDLSAIDAESVGPFVDVLVGRINHLPMLHNWLSLAVACSSFPEEIKLKPTECGIYPRVEEAIFEALIKRSDELLRFPIYGDYAVEHPRHRKSVRAQPSAHVRYTIKGGYLIAKGTTTKKPHGYEAIYPVADSVVGHTAFSGKRFSRGDDFLDQLARFHGKTGNASTWRWAATDHHFAMVVQFLRSHSVIRAAVEEKSAEGDVQAEMFNLDAELRE